MKIDAFTIKDVLKFIGLVLGLVASAFIFVMLLIVAIAYDQTFIFNQ